MRYRQGVQHLTVCCTPVQINISLIPKLHTYRGAEIFCIIILYVNDGVEAYICQGYEATNQESDLAKDLMKNYRQCLPVVRQVALRVVQVIPGIGTKD